MMSEVKVMAHEKELRGLSGWLVVFIILLVVAGAIWTLVNLDADWTKAAVVAVLVLDAACLAGLAVVNPNEAVSGHVVRRL